MNIINNLKDFINGWIIGNFSPSLIKSNDIEVAVFYLKKGDQGDGHFHKIATEYNIILQGLAEKNGKELKTGDIFTYYPEECSYVKYLEDTILLVIKTPSIQNDKFYLKK